VLVTYRSRGTLRRQAGSAHLTSNVERQLFRSGYFRFGSVAASGLKHLNDYFQSDPAVDSRPRRFPIELAAPGPQAAAEFSWFAVGTRPKGAGREPSVLSWKQSFDDLLPTGSCRGCVYASTLALKNGACDCRSLWLSQQLFSLDPRTTSQSRLR